MDKVYDGLKKIFERGRNEWGNNQSFEQVAPFRKVDNLAREFCENERKKGSIKNYIVDSFSFPCGPSSTPGVCIVTWIDAEGCLQSINYEWED